MSILCKTPSIRDVIAFPKTGAGTDPLFESPAPAGPYVLDQYRIGAMLGGPDASEDAGDREGAKFDTNTKTEGEKPVSTDEVETQGGSTSGASSPQ